ncbi:MAG: hypothetical protein LBT18_02005 [Endomicrobium sp.]|nr:hypothetical protein [Endomicrobium sp.]
MKKVASMLLALALLGSPMKSAFAADVTWDTVDEIWNTVKERTAVAVIVVGGWILENRKTSIVGLAGAVGVGVCV